MKYITVQTAARNVRRHGRNSYQAKVDLSDAFKFVTVNPKYWHLLGSTWWRKDSNGNMIKEYYVDTVLPFGLKQSPRLFDMFAQGLEWVMKCKGVSCVEHYLDDYHTVAHNRKACARNLKLMLDACRELGFEVNPKKVVHPTTRLEFLGIIIDSNTMELQISEERLFDTKSELCTWLNRKHCSKRNLLSIIGKLNFVSQVVRSGQTFIRRLIDLSKKAKHLHHRLRINHQAREDFKWWLTYLSDWNGISFMPEENWISSATLELFSDASDLAIGCTFGNQWFYETLNDTCRSHSINWRELFAIVKSIATFGDQLANKNVTFWCDNLSVVYIINSGTSTNSDIMTLVRSLFYYCAHHNIQCRAQWVKGSTNTNADDLSRLRIKEFLDNNPHACEMSLPKPIVYNDYML